MGHAHSTREGETRRHRYPSGNVYDGQWKRNKRHGKGTLTWVDGTTYTGDWRNNKQEGFGVMRFRNGNVYEGQFADNNFSGNGTLRTTIGEIVAGSWEFLGRSNSNLTGQQSVVGKYRLDVTITDTISNQRQGYAGQATVHLDTGLVVLPGMPSPDAAVLPYATAVAAESGREIFGNAMSINNGPATAVAVAAPEGPNPASSFQLQATPVTAAEARIFDDQAALEQRLIDAEEAEEMRTAPVAGSTSVAYGVRDPALDPRPLHPQRKIEVFDPRNYF